MAASKAISSHPEAERAATNALEAGGSSVDAVLAGFLAIGAVEPGALLGPLAIMTAGVGLAPRFIDGRSAQPGLSLTRPRGVRDDEPIAPAALAAAPRSLAALAVAHAFGGTLAFEALVHPAALLAATLGAERRARFLRAFASHGATVLAQSDSVRALLSAAGTAANGMLGEEDLRPHAPLDEAMAFVALAGGSEAALSPSSFPTAAAHAPQQSALQSAHRSPQQSAHRSPQQSALQSAQQSTHRSAQQSSQRSPKRSPQPSAHRSAQPAPQQSASARQSEIVLAADALGSVAALACAPDPGGIEVAALELKLPRDAIAVRRGVPRVPPGTQLYQPLPIALVRHSEAQWLAAIGVPAPIELTLAELGGHRTIAALLARLLASHAGGVAFAAAATRGRRGPTTQVCRAPDRAS
ncbi:MAG: hypothetical protein EXR75_13820 [Myxococcales bacterium]|nr:hypothetical protein [Myxococcales bacterium]